MKIIQIISFMALLITGCSDRHQAPSSPTTDTVVQLNAKDGVLTGEADFGSFMYGGSNLKIMSFMLTNNGTEPLSGPATIDNPNAHFYLSFSNCPDTLPVNKTCLLKISFDPRNSAPGSYVANLNFDSVFVSMTANIESPTGAATVQFQMSSAVVTGVDFGEISPKGNVIKSITIKNNGPLPITSSVTLSSPDFTLGYDACSGKNIKLKGTCILKVIMSGAGKEGNLSSLLSFGADSLSLTGRVITPSVAQGDPLASLRPNVVFLDSALEISNKNMGVFLDNQSGQAILSAKNIGNLASNSESLSLSDNTNFKLVYNACVSTSLGVDQSCQFRVAFSSAQKTPGLYTTVATLGSKSIVISATYQSVICPINQHYYSGSCAADVVSCSNISAGIATGSKTWNSGTEMYGTCQATSGADCLPGYNYSNSNCDLANVGVLAKQYEPAEDLLAIASYTQYYTNNANFARLLQKFTLTQKSYVNSFQIKVNSMSGAGFGVATAANPNETGLDGHVMIRTFDNFQSGSGLKTFSYNDSGLLLEPGNYYIMDMGGYTGGSYTIPLYYAPSNVAYASYGRECDFGYGPCLYNGGIFIPFSTPPQNYAPYFKVNTTPYVSPLAFSPTLKDNNLTLSNSNKTLSASSAPVISWGYLGKYINTATNGKYYIELKFTTPNYSYVGGNFLNSDPTIFYNASWPFALTAGYTGFYTHQSEGILFQNSGGSGAISSLSWTDQSVVMLALDLQNNKVWQGVNGVWSSGNPAINIGGLDISLSRSTFSRFYFAVGINAGSVEVLTTNQYAAPSGFVAP